MAKDPSAKQIYDLVSKKFDLVFTQLQSIQTDIRQLHYGRRLARLERSR